MATDKKGFILYADQQSIFNKLPDDKAGQLIKLIYSYVNDENPIIDDLLLDIAFEPIKKQLKRDLELYEKKRKQFSDAGKASAAAKKERKQQNSTTLNVVEKPSTESTVNGNVIVSERVIVNDKEINNKLTFKNFYEDFRYKEGFTEIINLFSKDVRDDLSDSNKINWCKSYKHLIELDNHTEEEILKVVTFARSTDWIAQNFQALPKLRKKKDGVSYYTDYKNRMLNPIKPKEKTKKGGRVDYYQKDIQEKAAKLF